MEPISPVIPNLAWLEKTYAKDQPEYIPLPTLVCDSRVGDVCSRWHMTWRERLRVLLHGDIYVRVKTFNYPLQPLLLTVKEPLEEVMHECVRLAEAEIAAKQEA